MGLLTDVGQVEEWYNGVVSVRDAMLDITGREVQRLATDRCVFLRRFESIGHDPAFLSKVRGSGGCRVTSEYSTLARTPAPQPGSWPAT